MQIDLTLINRMTVKRRDITRKRRMHGAGVGSFLKKKLTQCFKGKRGAQCNPPAAATPSANRNSAAVRLAKRQEAAAKRAAREAREAKEVDDALNALKKELGLPNSNSNSNNSGSGSPTERALRKLEKEIRREEELRQPLLTAN